MKKFLLSTLFIASLALLFSCQKDAALDGSQEDISSERLSQIARLGFNTGNVQRYEDGYLVEGDIVISQVMLNRSTDRKSFR